MATLTQTSSFARKMFVVLLQIAALILALFLLFRIGGVIYSRVVPPAPFSASVAFDKLPPIDLTESIDVPQGMDFRVETVTGDIPTLDSMAKVFRVKKSETTFGILEQTNKKAGSLGFSPAPSEVNQGIAKYVDLKRQDRILTVDTATDNFSIQSNFFADPEIISTRLRSLQDTVLMANRVLTVFGVDENTYPASKTSTVLYKIEGSRLANALSLSLANIVRVVFLKADLDSFPVYYKNVDDPLVWALVSQKEVLAAEKAARKIENFKFSTYPLKGSQIAFEELKGGHGVLNKAQTSNFFIVRSVKIGYAEGRLFEPYLQPVYIFESDDNLMAFVDAVSADWINQEPIQ